MNKPAYSVAVIGATGLVGAEIVAVLDQRQFPLAALNLYASLRSAGETVQCGTLTTRVELLDQARLTGTDLVFLAANDAVSTQWVERATAAGAIVIDLTHLHADDPDVPVVVPEVNAATLAGYAGRRLVVSPDPTAIALAVALAPLHNAAGIRRVVASTLEPASTAGRAGIEELQRETAELLNGRSPGHEIFPRRLAFNAVPQVGELLAGGTSGDEARTIAALRRVLGAADLPMSVTRVRIPIFFGIGITVNVETAQPLDPEEGHRLLRTAPGLLVDTEVDAPAYVTPADTVGQDAVCVGRIRSGDASPHLDLWLTIDNLRKGSAVNAVQIAEILIQKYL